VIGVLGRSDARVRKFTSDISQTEWSVIFIFFLGGGGVSLIMIRSLCADASSEEKSNRVE